jgi:hypothetical protein
MGLRYIHQIPSLPLHCAVDVLILQSTSLKGGHFNPLNAELNPICNLLALLGAHFIFHVSRIMVKVSQYIQYHLFFPFASSMWHFPDILNLTTSLLLLLKGTDID